MLDATAILRDFLSCRYKAFLKLTKVKGEVSVYEELQAILNAEHRERAKAFLLQRFPKLSGRRRPQSIQAAVCEGGLFFDVDANDSTQSWTFDAIESSPGPDRDGERLVRPFRFVHAVKLTANDKVLAASDGIRLATALGRSVEQVNLVHGTEPLITRLKLTTKKGATTVAKVAQKTLTMFETMIRDTSIEPKLILNSHCEVCEFRQRCRAEAVRRDDLSLLRGLQQADIESLNVRGIFTVTQLAYTCRPKSMGRSKSAPKKHSIPLQAMAVRDKTVYVRMRPELPQTPVSIYMDVESVPEREFHYLIGLVIDRPEDSITRQFWADSEADERAIWEELQQELANAGHYTLFHFGRYESRFLEAMHLKYGPQDAVIPQSRLCDVLAMIRTNVFFPAYSNGLKVIAGELGATWSGPITSGLDSIAWRHRWERERQASLKDDLLRYNLEDCNALKTLTAFLANLDQEGNGDLEVKTTDRIPNSSACNFGQSRFALPELARFTKCAYFNYQRDKVHIRGEKRIRTSSSRKQRRRKSRSIVDKRIECAMPAICPKCGAEKITTCASIRRKRVIQELRFTTRGVKRREVEYTTARYQCLECRNTFYSNEYPTKAPKFDHTVAAWSVYQQIALRQTGYAIAESFHDLFGLWVTPSIVLRLRRWLAAFHEQTEVILLERLRRGNLICADEAKIEIKRTKGYVWVFSNTEEVLYRFSPSREARVVEDVLSGFDGVLVSDFYAAYDLPAFKQQKCLVHLIRNINDDLLKTPFNAELKELAERFTELLKQIIDAVDRYGLKKRHLQKFLIKSNRFLEWTDRSEFQTEVARGYQKRFQKHGTRMFTFLSHDGIPWNNNLAENAVKLIASRRTTLGVSFSEEGIRDYLRFLSIYQTLRRKGSNFLRFLLSKKTDLFAFVGE
ncbi:MAG: transposase [Schlesneria sp.]|nr:transposase [Schlesneria sp.]